MAFAIPFRLGHAEVPVKLLLGIASFLFRHDHDGLTLEEREACHDGGIVAEVAVAMQFRELRKDPLDVIEGMRPLGMPCQQHPPPSLREWGRGGIRLGFRVHVSP